MSDRKSRSVLFRTPKHFTLLEIRDAVDSVLGCDCIEVMQELPSGEFLLQLNNKDNREELMEVDFNVTSHVTHRMAFTLMSPSWA